MNTDKLMDSEIREEIRNTHKKNSSHIKPDEERLEQMTY